MRPPAFGPGVTTRLPPLVSPRRSVAQRSTGTSPCDDGIFNNAAEWRLKGIFTAQESNSQTVYALRMIRTWVYDSAGAVGSDT